MRQKEVCVPCCVVYDKLYNSRLQGVCMRVKTKYAPNLKEIYLLRIISPWNLIFVVLSFLIIKEKWVAILAAATFLMLTGVSNVIELYKTYCEVEFTTSGISLTRGVNKKVRVTLSYSHIKYMGATRRGWGSGGYDSLDLFIVKKYDEPVKIYRGYFKPVDFIAIKERIEKHVPSRVDDWAKSS